MCVQVEPQSTGKVIKLLNIYFGNLYLVLSDHGFPYLAVVLTTLCCVT